MVEKIKIVLGYDDLTIGLKKVIILIVMSCYTPGVVE